MDKTKIDSKSGEIILEKVKFGMQGVLIGEALRGLAIYQRDDFIADELVYALKGWMLGESVEKREMQVTFFNPATWWQMFKASYFPDFLVRKFPIREKVVEKKVHFEKWACYPKLPGVFKEGTRTIKFVDSLFVEEDL